MKISMQNRKIQALKTSKVSCAAVIGLAVIWSASISTIPAAFAQPGVIKLRSGTTTATIRVTKGKPQTVRTNRAFSEIVVGDPEIADASPLTDNSFYILGGKIGTTGIALLIKIKL